MGGAIKVLSNRSLSMRISCNVYWNSFLLSFLRTGNLFISYLDVFAGFSHYGCVGRWESHRYVEKEIVNSCFTTSAFSEIPSTLAKTSFGTGLTKCQQVHTNHSHMLIEAEDWVRHSIFRSELLSNARWFFDLCWCSREAISTDNLSLSHWRNWIPL